MRPQVSGGCRCPEGAPVKASVQDAPDLLQRADFDLADPLAGHAKAAAQILQDGYGLGSKKMNEFRL